jgi:hypothetical protein
MVLCESIKRRPTAERALIRGGLTCTGCVIRKALRIPLVGQITGRDLTIGLGWRGMSPARMYRVESPR